MNKQAINVSQAPKPVGLYPHARRVGNLLFLSGVGPRQAGTDQIPGVKLDSDGRIISYDIAAQCHSVFQNVRTILEASNANWMDLVDVTVFLTNMDDDFAIYNRIYAEYFADNQPCRTTVEINKLPTPIGIELKCIAALPMNKPENKPGQENQKQEAPMSYSLPFSLNTWIEDHREFLQPPVCNKQVFEEDDFIVMVVGGPNNRTDYHYNETPELFFQIEGEMNLAVVDEGEFKDIPIKAGEIFLLPPGMLHSPQRFAGSVGLVVEQKRAPGQEDALFWFCPNCKQELYSEKFLLGNIEKDLPVVFANFYDNPENCTCGACGTQVKKD